MFNGLFDLSAIKMSGMAQSTGAVSTLVWASTWIVVEVTMSEHYNLLTDTDKIQSLQTSHPHVGHCQHWEYSPVAQLSVC